MTHTSDFILFVMSHVQPLHDVFACYVLNATVMTIMTSSTTN